MPAGLALLAVIRSQAMNAYSGNILGENVPRYTSYPTAPHFHAGVGEAQAREWMARLGPGDAVSLYVHVPYCDKLCWFCACHTKHTLRYEPVAAFLKALRAEIALVAPLLPQDVRLDAIHFGGGSPTLLLPEDFVALTAALRSAFPAGDGAALSVEIDPNDMDEARLDALAAAGLARASIGVQDFDPRVQRAINRLQSFELTRTVVEGVRARGATSVNLDLLYGLPHQTVDSVAETARLALSLRPERIALFGYAHVPWFKKHQTMIDEASLPDAAERLAQSQEAAALIVAAGYRAIGIDHFALPGDRLAEAALHGRLRRNFQGYTDDQCETLIGLGPSSVSRFRQGYVQNVATTGEYEKAVLAGRLPAARGIELSREDAAEAWLIERLMCDFGFSAEELLRRFGEHGRSLLGQATDLARQEPESLMECAGRFSVPPARRPLVRTVAARFDRYLRKGAARHSAAV